MKTYYLLITLLTIFYSFIAYGKLRNIESTRMKSVGGSGIASILIAETSFLNPASIVFYDKSLVYYQKDSANLSNNASQRTNEYGPLTNEAYVIADTSSALKGTASIQKQSENNQNRLRYTSSLASAVGPSTSMGFIVRYTQDTMGDVSNYYTQTTLGLTHILSEEVILGAVIDDLFTENRKEDYKIAIGFQYTFKQNISLLFDFGANTQLSTQDNTFSKYGVQFNLFSDFYIRVGSFYNQIENLQGRTWGLSWSGPKLDLFYAYKNSNQIIKNNDFLINDEELLEHSISLAVRF